jgi:tRNA A37 threonylcarbamoyltransferase TsaD
MTTLASARILAIESSCDETAAVIENTETQALLQRKSSFLV